MRDYEMMIIIHPDLDAQAIKGVLDGVTERIGRVGGEVTKADLLGRRRLTYEMRKQTQGTYAHVYFKTEPANIQGLKSFLQVEHRETVLRYLLLIDEKRGFQPPSQPMPEQAEAAPAPQEESVQVVVEGADEAEAAGVAAEAVAAGAPVDAAVETAAAAEVPAAAEAVDQPAAGEETTGQPVDEAETA